MLYTWPFWCY